VIRIRRNWVDPTGLRKVNRRDAARATSPAGRIGGTSGEAPWFVFRSSRHRRVLMTAYAGRTTAGAALFIHTRWISAGSSAGGLAPLRLARRLSCLLGVHIAASGVAGATEAARSERCWASAARRRDGLSLTGYCCVGPEGLLRDARGHQPSINVPVVAGVHHKVVGGGPSTATNADKLIRVARAL